MERVKDRERRKRKEKKNIANKLSAKDLAQWLQGNAKFVQGHYTFFHFGRPNAKT